jgi:flagellar motor switch protein FliG
MTTPALSDAERAAVMVMLLDETKAATMLAQLDPHELQVLGEKMCNLGEIGPELIRQAIAGFVGA